MDVEEEELLPLSVVGKANNGNRRWVAEDVVVVVSGAGWNARMDCRKKHNDRLSRSFSDDTILCRLIDCVMVDCRLAKTTSEVCC